MIELALEGLLTTGLARLLQSAPVVGECSGPLYGRASFMDCSAPLDQLFVRSRHRTEQRNTRWKHKSDWQIELPRANTNRLRLR